MLDEHEVISGGAADWEVQRRGIRIVPDLLANAGGVTCTYLEQVRRSDRLQRT